jgi:hypothetical protein
MRNTTLPEMLSTMESFRHQIQRRSADKFFGASTKGLLRESLNAEELIKEFLVIYL